MLMNHLGHYGSPLALRSQRGYKVFEPPPRPQRRLPAPRSAPPSLPWLPWPFSLLPRNLRLWAAVLFTLVVMVTAVVAVFAASSCVSHDLCRANSALYALTQAARLVLPANPLQLDVNQMRNFLASSRPAVDFSKHNVTVHHAVAQPGNVKLRVYAPAGANTARKLVPVVLWFHGGGWMLGDAQDDAQCVALLQHIRDGGGAVVVSVEYRLAPEHPYPAAVDDATAALRWARKHARTYGGHRGRIVLAGESSGGNVAVAAALANYDRARTPLLARAPLAGLLLLYPCLDYGHVYPSYLNYGGADYPLLSLRSLLFYWSNYLGSDAWRSSRDYRAGAPSHLRPSGGFFYQWEWEGKMDETYLNSFQPYRSALHYLSLPRRPTHHPAPAPHPPAVPMRAPRHLLARLPPTAVVLAKFDVLADEGRAFYAKLQRARRRPRLPWWGLPPPPPPPTPDTLVVYNDTVHGFFAKMSTAQRTAEVVTHLRMH